MASKPKPTQQERILTIAQAMRTALAGYETGYVRKNLTPDLEAILSRTDLARTLKLMRRDRAVAPAEIEYCRAAFAAPADAEPLARTGWIPPITGGERQRYHIAELTWREL